MKEGRDRPRVLNLFAYTGGATVACAMAGAALVHVDASKGMTNAARENMALSGLADAPCRYIVDDCQKFVEREIRRGNRYDGVIMDPPSYGRGPGGEVWKLEECAAELVETVVKVLSDEPLFFLINSYTAGLSPAVMQYILLRALPEAVIKDGTFGFATPAEIVKKYKPVSDIAVEDPISWADEERDVTAWLGNELQSEAFKKVYAMTEKLAIVNDPELYEDFGHLQESDHFYYMCTKFFSDGEVHKYFNPYDTPYEAFINYMNVISDFQIRLDEKRAALDVTETAREEIKAPVAKAPRKKVAKKK